MRYGFIKPAVDAHTLGLISAGELLRECGYEVLVADEPVAEAMNDYRHEVKRRIVLDWIREEQINRLAVSYRLDRQDAVNMMGYLIEALRQARLMAFQGGPVEQLFYAGLPDSCVGVEQSFPGMVRTFRGGESARETLLILGVPDGEIPHHIYEGSQYDDNLMAFGQDLVREDYRSLPPPARRDYPEFGSRDDSLVRRLRANSGPGSFVPLTRAHVGPYDAEASRRENLDDFLEWCRILAGGGHLDILSVGSSQLSQSNFGEDWGDKVNGGGVPVNSPEEYREIYEASRPLLTRTYAGTKDMPGLARIYEETLNISWHALSLWWFNRLDSRGPYDLYTSLKEQFRTIDYIAETGKPLEANTSHHFAFRGCDDVTYIVAEYLAAKLAKQRGIQTFIVQNMLNTPRMTWGVQDLAKSRATLQLLKPLEDADFRLLLQPRAGLDYFKPDLEEAKAQLAAVSALMDDIDPHNEQSPPVIHVVSYSEASHLATPDVIEESVQITRRAIERYRELRRRGIVDDMSKSEEVSLRQAELYQAARKRIEVIESGIRDPYSPEGFYLVFAAGFLPVPYLWGDVEEFPHAVDWQTKPVRGGLKLVDQDGKVLTPEQHNDMAVSNLRDAEHNLRQRQLRSEQQG